MGKPTMKIVWMRNGFNLICEVEDDPLLIKEGEIIIKKASTIRAIPMQGNDGQQGVQLQFSPLMVFGKNDEINKENSERIISEAVLIYEPTEDILSTYEEYDKQLTAARAGIVIPGKPNLSAVVGRGRK